MMLGGKKHAKIQLHVLGMGNPLGFVYNSTFIVGKSMTVTHLEHQWMIWVQRNYGIEHCRHNPT